LEIERRRILGEIQRSLDGRHHLRRRHPRIGVIAQNLLLGLLPFLNEPPQKGSEALDRQ